MDTKNTNTALLTWMAPERLPVKRGHVWYVAMGILAVGSAVWSILSGAWTFTIVIVLGAPLYFLHVRKVFPAKKVELREEGVAVDNVLTPWSQCVGFWIYQHKNAFALHIEKQRGWTREVVLYFDEKDFERIAEIVGAFVPYRETHRENLLDAIIRICKL